jgi:hypothetical protein
MSTPNIAIIDKLLQFILLIAGQEDDFMDRELGPIHLIKYLYLADLAYAEHHHGEIYTGLSWTFHHFGPWSPEAHQRIEPALLNVGATSKTFRSQYSDDAVRWSIQDDSLYRQLVTELPITITRAIQRYVHQFTADTEELLHIVCKTWPMLRAKPEERLHFILPEHLKREDTRHVENNHSISQSLSTRQKKKRKQAFEKLKKEVKERLEKEKKARRMTFSPPPYDDIFYEGVKTLDALTGIEIKETTGTLYFSDDIWTSKARHGPDVS